MTHPRIPDELPPDNTDHWRRFVIPKGRPLPDDLLEYEFTKLEQLDRRLKGFYLACSVSAPPDDPGRVLTPIIPLHGSPVDGWQLWLAILRWPGSPVAGELRYEPIYGWCAGIFYQKATSREVTRIHHGLEVLQQRIPAPWRPKGSCRDGVGDHEDLNSFLAKARRARDLHRQRGKPFSQASLAKDVGMSRRNFQRTLARCEMTWEEFAREPTRPCAKEV